MPSPAARPRVMRMASATAVVLLSCFAASAFGGTTQHTQECELRIDGAAKDVHLACRRLTGAPDCQLTAFHSQTGGFKLSAPPGGGLIALSAPVPAPRAPSKALNSAHGGHQPLRRQPLLHLRGSPECHVLFTKPSIHNVTLTEVAQRHEAQPAEVLVLAGGLRATFNGGHITHNRAASVVALLEGSRLNIHGLTLAHNDVQDGVLSGSSGSHLTLTNATSTNNAAQACGGVVTLRGSTAHIAASTFAGNAAKAGGAVCCRASKLSISHAHFLDNSADLAGAVFASNSSTGITSCSFSGNTARVGGGAALLVGATAVIDQARFHNNTARVAGALMALNSTASVQRCAFTANQARIVGIAPPVDKDGWTGTGGAMYVGDSNCTIHSSWMSGNKAISFGGAVSIYNQVTPGHAVIHNCSINDNYAKIHGGGVYVATKDDTQTSLGRFIDCYSKGKPALLLSNSVLHSNRAGASGGGIVIYSGAFVNITNSTISNCSAFVSGSGLGTLMRADDWPAFYMKTRLSIDATFVNNHGTAGRTVSIGLMFNATFPNKPKINISSPGVDYRYTICGMGEYNLPGSAMFAAGFCEPCAAYTYSFDTSHKFKPACRPAPNNTYAPGWAVLVPLERFCHGHGMQQDGPPPESQLTSVKRCPNPAACLHDPVQLAERHPYNTTTPNPLSWRDYGKLLCTTQHGYIGVFCGECLPGFGSTAPFICQQCFGAAFDVSSGIAPVMTRPPTRAGISLMWLLYWIILTLVYLYGVWSAMPNRNTHILAADHQDTHTAPHGATALPSCGQEVPPAAPSSSRQQPAQRGQAGGGRSEPSQPAQPARCDGEPCAESSHVNTSPLDVIKALTVYYGWVRLILALPISWMPPLFGNHTGTVAVVPTASGASTTPSWHQAQTLGGLESLVTLVLGGPSCLSCLFQAWGLWQQDGDASQDAAEWDMAAPVLAAAFIRAIIIPLVFILTATLLHLSWYKLRAPVLRYLSRHRCIPRPLPVLVLTPHTSATTSQPAPCSNGCGLSTCPSGSISWSSAAPFAAYFRVHLLTTALVVYFASYDTLAKTALGLLWCVDLAETDQRWVLDVRLSCPAAMEGWWRVGWASGAVVLGLFLLLVVCIGLPIWFGAVLLRKAWRQGSEQSPCSCPADLRAKANHIIDVFESNVAAGLAYRYSGYAVKGALLTEPNWRLATRRFGTLLAQLRLAAVLCWDSILDLHRLLLAVVSMSVMLNELHQLLLVTAVLGGYLVLILAVRPWKSSATTHLQVGALLVLLSSCCGIMAWDVRVDGSSYCHTYYKQILPWVVLGLNACYVGVALTALLWCTVRLLRNVSSKGLSSCMLSTAHSG